MSCRLEWKRLSGEMYEKETRGHDGVPNTDPLTLLLQRDAAGTHDTNADEPAVASVWENLKAELTLAQVKVPATVEQVLAFSRRAFGSRGERRKGLAIVEREAATVVEEPEKLEYERRSAILNLQLMEDWTKMVTDVD